MDVETGLSVGESLYAWFGPGGLGLCITIVILLAILWFEHKSHAKSVGRARTDNKEAFQIAADLATTNAQSRERWAVAMEGFGKEVAFMRQKMDGLTGG
jgi:hypothetical protein